MNQQNNNYITLTTGMFGLPFLFLSRVDSLHNIAQSISHKRNDVEMCFTHKPTSLVHDCVMKKVIVIY